MTRETSPRRRHRTAQRLGSLILVLTTGVAACGDVTSLKQDAPSRVLAGDLLKPQNAALLVDGAIGDFECAYANYIVATGLISDELADAQLGASGWDYDRRTAFPAWPTYSSNGCSVQFVGLYTPLSVARFQGDQAARLLQGWTDQEVPKRPELIATASAYAGYSLVLLAESMCSAAIDLGPELTSKQLAAEAETRFTRALEAASAASKPDLVSLARLGRARARLDQGNLTGAAEDAAAVPDGFVWNATYAATPTRRENRVYTQLWRDNFATVDPSFRGLTWAGAPDPRVTVIDGGTNGQDGVTRVFRTTKYPSIDAPIPIARSAEARLIEAEAAVASGNVQRAVDIINALHAAAGIAPYAGGTAAEVKAQVIEERRRELFLEGHRFGDVLRYGVELQPAAGTPFKQGGLYGPTTCLPLPDIERNNNPNIGGKA
ncbi:MAG: RagB/SusD family nutrient uptake outer membrane protein [Gemmatimonadetes bacterium]|nr:RagB/SusD family nutrient uptake outer membrane protein [Gemmatimonadota bacterium]